MHPEHEHTFKFILKLMFTHARGKAVCNIIVKLYLSMSAET